MLKFASWIRECAYSTLKGTKSWISWIKALRICRVAGRKNKKSHIQSSRCPWVRSSPRRTRGGSSRWRRARSSVHHTALHTRSSSLHGAGKGTASDTGPGRELSNCSLSKTPTARWKKPQKKEWGNCLNGADTRIQNACRTPASRISAGHLYPECLQSTWIQNTCTIPVFRTSARHLYPECLHDPLFRNTHVPQGLCRRNF